MKIRLVRHTDMADIAKIHIESWQQAYRGIVPDEFLDAMDLRSRTELWEKRFAAVQDSLFVAEVASEVRAWALCGKSRVASDDTYMSELYAIYADPQFWGQGLGRGLIEAVHAHVIEHAYTRIMLWVLTDNQRARRFYESCGYVNTEIRQNIEISGVQIEELRYERSLQTV
ncbi:MAG: GNAT family N-acetyltransferase [Ignavibacteriae bacterium]|nr:MAG: GNAT family N-acetyltransferase [Ignavibacteriota bacterium]